MSKAGMKLIVKRASGYKVQIRKTGLPPINRTFDALKEAQEFRDRMLIAIKKGNAPDFLKADTITIHHAITSYLENYTPNKKSAQSEKSLLKTIEVILASLGYQHIPLSEFDLRKAKSFIVQREHWHRGKRHNEKKTAPKTVINTSNLLSLVLDKIIYNENLTIDNPMKKLERPKVNNERDVRIPPEDIDEIIDALPDVIDYVKEHLTHKKYFSEDDIPDMPFIIRLAVNAGLRRGEITQLRLNDFKLKTTKPYINLRTSITKTSKPRRVVLNKTILPECAEHIKQALVKKKPSDLLTDIHKDNISHIFQFACEIAGQEGLRFHDLRHECTSRLVEAGISIPIAMKITGHKTLQMIDRYTHLRHEEQAEALEKAGL